MGRVLALGVLIWAGCIDFEKQTMTYRHFSEADMFVIWQQYEGLFGDSGKNGLSDEELEQLHPSAPPSALFSSPTGSLNMMSQKWQRSLRIFKKN